MKELVEYIAKAIAASPDDVKVTEGEAEDGRLVLTLDVAPDDKGKVIGRQGRVAQAMRVMLRDNAQERSGSGYFVAVTGTVRDRSGRLVKCRCCRRFADSTVSWGLGLPGCITGSPMRSIIVLKSP